MLLRKGDLFEFYEGEPGVWEVVRVGPSGAIVRPLTKVHRVIKDIDGSVKAEFDAPGRSMQISNSAMVRRVEREKEDGSKE